MKPARSLCLACATFLGPVWAIGCGQKAENVPIHGNNQEQANPQEKINQEVDRREKDMGKWAD